MQPAPIPSPAVHPARARALGRALLPEVVLAEDIALALHVTPSAARCMVHRGELGAYLRLGRRLCVRRESLLAALQAREIVPPPPATPRDVPPPRSDLVDALRPRLRRGGAR